MFCRQVFQFRCSCDEWQARTQCVAEAESCASSSSSSSLDRIERRTPPTAKWSLFSFGELVRRVGAVGTLTNRISACDGDRMLGAVHRHQRSTCLPPAALAVATAARDSLRVKRVVSKILSVDRRGNNEYSKCFTIYSLRGEVTYKRWGLWVCELTYLRIYDRHLSVLLYTHWLYDHSLLLHFLKHYVEIMTQGGTVCDWGPRGTFCWVGTQGGETLWSAPIAKPLLAN